MPESDNIIRESVRQVVEFCDGLERRLHEWDDEYKRPALRVIEGGRTDGAPGVPHEWKEGA
jgi:hypothetical protein